LWSKTDRCAGALSWRRNQLFFSIFGVRKRNMSMRISLFTVVISVKYTAEFWEMFEATLYSKSNFTPHFSSFVRIIHPFIYLHIF
jgi:hypothetical protein